MKTWSLILIFGISIILSSAFLLKSNESQDPAQLVARALSDVIREFHIANNIQLDLIICGEQTQHLKDVTDFMIEKLSSEKSIKIEHMEDISKIDFIRKESKIILTKSAENLLDLNLFAMRDGQRALKYFGNPRSRKGKLVVYTEEISTLDQLRNVFKDINNKNISQYAADLRFFEFFIINGHKSVDLAANVLYSEDSCGIFVQKSINSFDKIAQNWETGLENFEQDQNFDGCMLTLVARLGFRTFYRAHYELIDGNNVEKVIRGPERPFVLVLEEIKYSGLINEVMTTLAIRSNFTFNPVGDLDVRGYAALVLNKNFKLLRDDDVIEMEYGVMEKVFENYPKYITNPIIHEENYLLVTDNDLYSNYEKIFLAFDFTTWLLILMVYGMTFLAIAVVHVTSRKFRKIVFGEGVNIPAYNALGIFFGIGQIKLPKRFFGRFILLLYIWFCLMIRTCYQSKMFEFITSDMRKPLPKTIEDLKYWDYTIVTAGEVFTQLVTRHINERDSPEILTIDLHDFKLLYGNAVTGKSTTKYAFFMIPDWHAVFNATFKTSLKVLSDERMPVTFALNLPQNNILSYQLDYVVDQFISAGITKHLNDYAMWFLCRPIHVPIEDPRRILTFEMLEFGFVLWFAACCLSTFVFVCECRSLWMKRKLRILIGLIDFLRVLWHRMQDYHDRW